MPMPLQFWKIAVAALDAAPTETAAATGPTPANAPTVNAEMYQHLVFISSIQKQLPSA